MNLLNCAVSSLDKVNNNLILNGANKRDNKIKPFSDNNFKKMQIQFMH